ncbi:PRC-barrel domain containing protein [Mesorhizobium sp. M0870]|uniref:PRC-barrel domain containing protein n=1 Tax=Mesorhizobium sp. M0870 TaxID=2957016 RepID=UPI003337D3F5
MDHTNHVRLTSTELTPDLLEDATIYDIGAKPVAVPASQLEFMRDEDGDVHAVTNWTKDQLKSMPEHHDA